MSVNNSLNLISRRFRFNDVPCAIHAWLACSLTRTNERMLERSHSIPFMACSECVFEEGCLESFCFLRGTSLKEKKMNSNLANFYFGNSLVVVVVVFVAFAAGIWKFLKCVSAVFVSRFFLICTGRVDLMYNCSPTA